MAGLDSGQLPLAMNPGLLTAGGGEAVSPAASSLCSVAGRSCLELRLAETGRVQTAAQGSRVLTELYGSSSCMRASRCMAGEGPGQQNPSSSPAVHPAASLAGALEPSWCLLQLFVAI